MKSIVIGALLVACGGGTTSTPPPRVTNTTTAKSEPAPEAVKLKPCHEAANPEAEMECAVARMDVFKMKMCTCIDKKCADGVNEEMLVWSQEMAKHASKRAPPKSAPQSVKRMTEIATRLGECYVKLAMPAVPPDPCAGSAAP